MRALLETGQGGLTLMLGPSRGPAAQRSDALALRVLTVLEKHAPNPRNSAERARTLIRLGRHDDAAAIVEANLATLLSDPRQSPFARQLVNVLHEPEMVERGVAVFARLAKSSPSAALEAQRMSFLARADAEAYYAELERQMAESPTDVNLLARLMSLRSSRGQLVDAYETAQDLVRRFPKAKRYANTGKSYAKRLAHPTLFTKVPAGKGAAKAKAAKRPTGARSIAGLPSAATRLITAARAVPIASGSVVFTSSGGIITRRDPVSSEILKLQKQGKTAEAKRKFRRFWRNIDAPNRYVRFPMNLHANSFKQFTDKLPFLVDEVRIVLASIDGKSVQPGVRESLYEILASDVVKRARKEKDAEAALAREVETRAARLRRGVASTVDTELLLRLLLEVKEPAPKLVDEILAKGAEWSSGRLEMLARVLSASGQTARASAFYRVALLADPNAARMMRPKLMQIRKHFADKDAAALELALVDDVVPIGMNFASWVNVALDVWQRRVDKDKLGDKLVELQKLVGRVAPGSRYVDVRLPRPEIVIPALLRASHREAAIAELRKWLVRAPAPDVFSGRRPRPRGTADRVLASTFASPKLGLDGTRAIVAAVLEWHAAGKIEKGTDALAACARALVKHEGLGELRDRVAAALAALPRDKLVPKSRAAIAAALRTCKSEERADAIELGLLAKRALPVDRIAPLLKRQAEQKGVAASYELAVAAASYTWHDKLLDSLVAWAAELGRDDEAAAWKERLARVTAAQAAKKTKRAPRAKPPAGGARRR